MDRKRICQRNLKTDSCMEIFTSPDAWQCLCDDQLFGSMAFSGNRNEYFWRANYILETLHKLSQLNFVITMESRYYFHFIYFYFFLFLF